MSESAGATEGEPVRARVVAIETVEDEDRLDWEEWLAALEEDEPVSLPRPAVDYLHDARSAGEV